MNPIRLRPFQQDCYNILLNEILTWSGGDCRSAIVIPTGGGKTPIGAMLATVLWHQYGLRSIIVTHQHIIARQWHDMLQTLEAQFVPESQTRNYQPSELALDPVLVTSVWRPLPSCFAQQYQLLIFDEAHHATAKTWEVWFDRFPNAYKLGVTATPIRGDGTCVTKVFGKIVYMIDLRELINRGVLAEARGWRLKTNVDLSSVPIEGGDYRQSALGRKVNTPERNAMAVEAYRRWGEEKPGLVFSVDRAHAEALADHFTSAGYPSRAVHSGLKDAEVLATLDSFANGRVRLLTSCRKLLEGYNTPRAEVILLTRPFTQVSARVDLGQAVGRGLRRAPEKRYALVLELVDDNLRSRPGTVTELFGLPYDYDPQGAFLAVASNLVENQARQIRRRTIIDSVEADLRRRQVPLSSYSSPRLSQSAEFFDVVRYLENAMGLPCISDGEHFYIMLVDGCSVLIDQVADGLYRVTHRSRDGRPTTLTIAETVDKAFAVTEQRLLQLCGPRVLEASRRDARWRHDPYALATPNQLQTIQRLTSLEESLLQHLTKGSASDLITCLIANQVLRHRLSGRSTH